MHNSPGDHTQDLLVLRLLPALPSAWPSGRFRGLRSKGRIEVDVQWGGGYSIIEAKIRSTTSATSNAPKVNSRASIKSGGEPLRCRVLSRERLAWGGHGSGNVDAFKARIGFTVWDPVYEGGILWNVVDIDVGRLMPGEEVQLIHWSESG